MTNNTIVAKDNKITINVNGKSESYDLTAPVPENALIVKREKNEILHQMDLKTVIANLDNSVDLLDVSYHAVYGFRVQSKIFALQKTLMDLNDKGIIVIGQFKAKSAVITQELAGVFRWLTKGAEAVAVSKLEKFVDYAAGMGAQAEELANDYQRMSDNVSSVLQETMTESSKQYEKSDELRKMLADFQAKQSGSSETQAAISKRLKNLQSEYDRLSAAEEREDKQRNAMAIVGVVFSFLGRASNVAGNYISGQGADSSSPTPIDQTTLNDNKARKAEIDAQITTLNTEIAALNTQMSDVSAQKDSASDEEKQTLSATLTNLRDEIRQKKDKVNSLTNEQQKVAGVIEQLGGVFTDIGEEVKKAAPSEDLALQRSNRMKDIYDELIRLEEENTKQLGQLAEYTKKMESIVIDQDSTEAAVQALIIAVSCLKRVVVAVKDIALFWNAMEQCCKSLADASLLNDIKSLQEFDKDTRIAYYYDVDIMYPLLCCAAKWTAVYSISDEYIKAAEKTRFHLNETVITADSIDLSREDHWEKASSLASSVSDRIELQVNDGKNKIKAYEELKSN